MGGGGGGAYFTFTDSSTRARRMVARKRILVSLLISKSTRPTFRGRKHN